MRNKKTNTLNVMIVEDEKDLCFLLELILKQQNLSTKCANSLREARATLPNVSPNVLFLDNHLPDGSGVEFIHHIKEVHPSTKVVMITAYDTPGDVEKAFEKGADYFISKPFTIGAVKKVMSMFSVANIA
ncbi:MAG: response regulator [Ginsengibacter sp.]